MCALALLLNIRFGGKCSRRTNALAYSIIIYLTEKKLCFPTFQLIGDGSVQREIIWCSFLFLFVA
jgi:hypothetical protein